MEEQEKALTSPQQEDWRPRVYMFGGLIGMVIGLLASFLYVRAAEETHGEHAPQSPETSDAVRLGLTLLGVMRTISEWGKK